MKKEDKKAVYAIILGKIILWALGIAVIIMIILKLLEHSPTMDQIMVSLLGTILVSIITLVFAIGKHIGKVERFMKDSDRRFYSFARDFRKHLEHGH